LPQPAARRHGGSNRRALSDGGGEGAFVQIIEFAADRHAVGKARHLDVRVVQQVGDGVGGGLPSTVALSARITSATRSSCARVMSASIVRSSSADARCYNRSNNRRNGWARHIAMKRKPEADAEDALYRAQEMIYDAWEAGTPARRAALARQALAVSPLCADAYVILAGQAKRGSDEELDLWRRGFEAGEEAIGKAAFEEYAGHFWGVLETRPYMRARLGFAQALWARGEHAPAIDHLRDMLRLNPGDNQGIRYQLAGWLFEAERDDDLVTLFKAYPDDGGSEWLWTKALAAFRRAGDGSESRSLLDEAVAGNRHVPAYLLGITRLPKASAPYISPGGKDEAIYYVRDFGAGWRQTPGALDWLRARTVIAKESGRKPKRGSRLH